MNGTERIAAERKRQIEVEGWTSDHDKQYRHNELAWAAVCYAAPENPMKKRQVFGELILFDPWPWDCKWDKRRQHNRIRQLEIAGALCAAEIDRLLAIENKQ